MWNEIISDLKSLTSVQRVAIAIILALVVLAFAVVASQAEVPVLMGRVNDYYGALTPPQRATLETSLRQVDMGSRKGPQVAVLIPKSLDGMTVEQYAYTVARAWGLGAKGSDAGVLLVVAPKERKVRIEVGYGMEGTLPDARANAIIGDMKPFLKGRTGGADDWNGAIAKAVAEIKASVKQ